MVQARLLGRLEQLIDQVLSVDATIPELTGYFSLEDELVRQVRSMLRRTADLMVEIMEWFDAEAQTERNLDATSEADFFKEIGTEMAVQMAQQEISGMAFISRGHLLDTLKDLDRAIADGSLWKVASQCDTGLRRIGRAVFALDSSIREFEGLEPKYHKWHNLEDSLEIRRIYGAFRRAVLHDAGDLRQRFENALRRIGDLRHLEIYPYLRIDDRLQLRRFEERVRAWMESAGNAGREDGDRLWEDLCAFARLLAQINHRQELREHDRLAVDGIYRSLFETDAALPDELTAQHLAVLEPLLGCEDDLDRIILHPHEHRTQDLRAPLERLRKLLGQPFEVAKPGWPG